MISKRILKNLKPLNSTALQCYLGTGIHTLGLLGWILEQTGRADVYVSTFSTSEEFLNGFLNLRKKGLIRRAVMVADLKASKKTVKLNQLMSYCFGACTNRGRADGVGCYKSKQHLRRACRVYYYLNITRNFLFAI